MGTVGNRGCWGGWYSVGRFLSEVIKKEHTLLKLIKAFSLWARCSHSAPNWLWQVLTLSSGSSGREDIDWLLDILRQIRFGVWTQQEYGKKSSVIRKPLSPS